MVWIAFDCIMSCVVYGAFFPVDVPLQYNGNLQMPCGASQSPSFVTKYFKIFIYILKYLF